MMTRTEFLRAQTISGANKCRRAPIIPMSVSDEPGGIAERRALALKMIFEYMPIYIGPQELIVGTRTFFSPNKGNEDGHDPFQYGLYTYVPYLNEADIALFGCDQSYKNKTHYTPDFGIILEKGIDGILEEAENRKKDASLNRVNLDFLSAVVIAYSGLKGLILRYSEEARALAEREQGDHKAELLEVSRICEKISGKRPDTFHEAVQLLWFAHLGTIIESFEFINYGRLDVILGRYLKDTPREEAQQLVECLLLKMYDQVDIVTSYLHNYAAQLVVTLGGVLPDGSSAVNEVSMMFLEAIDKIRLPEPEFNLRINSKNPPEFLDKASELTISGCNFISYYNDDLFVESLNKAGILIEYARSYAFDLCQDINIPGIGDFFWLGSPSLAFILMDVLKDCGELHGFDELLCKFKDRIAQEIEEAIKHYNIAEEHILLYAQGQDEKYFQGIKEHKKPIDRGGCSPMAPLPLISPLYHGSMENALDIAFVPYPVKEKGMFFGTATEAINSLAAIKKVVYEEKRFSLGEIYSACRSNYQGEKGAFIKSVLWNCPKWGNNDDYVDAIAKDVLEFCLSQTRNYKTFLGGRVLGGIHQPHPVPTGKNLMATPEGRCAGTPVAVTLTPESGTAKNGPTAILHSAAKIDPMLVQWNYCVMVNYFASTFRGNNGKEIFKCLLTGYFKEGGLQHQPNVLNVEDLKNAQLEPVKYKDLIVRLWGVSAHFVDLPRELQDELIARFS